MVLGGYFGGEIFDGGVVGGSAVGHFVVVISVIGIFSFFLMAWGTFDARGMEGGTVLGLVWPNEIILKLIDPILS